MLVSLVYRLINVYYRIVTELNFDITSPDETRQLVGIKGIDQTQFQQYLTC
jgi:hypothetical protein